MTLGGSDDGRTLARAAPMDSLVASSSASTRAKALVRPRLTVVFFGVHEDILKACRLLARVLPFARAEARDLDAACTAVAVFSHAMLVVPRALCPRDREVVEERARGANKPVLWVGADSTVDAVVAAIRAWATAALRLGR